MTARNIETGPGARDLTFHIIFVPGSFAILGCLTLGLLRRLHCKLRLVSNGCRPEENRRMETFCRANNGGDNRMEFQVLSTDNMVDHGTALNRLQQMETSDYFCFMDADILATHDFLPQLLPLLRGHTAVFSGRPLWQSEGEAILPAGAKRIMGRYLRTSNDFLLGGSYFAIYRNPELKRFVHDYGFCFDRLNWADLTPRVTLLLVKMGLAAAYYDTGKILNILLQERGLDLAYHEPRGLLHIGGLSCGIAAEANGGGASHRPPKETRLKRRLAEHFLTWHRALISGSAMPPTPLVDDPEVREKVERSKRQISMDYHEFKDLY